MRRIWSHIREPRVQRVGMSIVYLLLAFGGLSALASPPSSIEGAIGPWLTMVWASFLLVGGACGAGSMWDGTWWLEKIGLWLIAGGAAAYSLVIISLHFTNEAGNRLPQFFIITALSLLFTLRAWEIRGLDYDPRG